MTNKFLGKGTTLQSESSPLASVDYVSPDEGIVYSLNIIRRVLASFKKLEFSFSGSWLLKCPTIHRPMSADSLVVSEARDQYRGEMDLLG
jgi:hypothetical protein